AGSELVQLATPVMSCVVSSVYVPIALSCTRLPFGRGGWAGPSPMLFTTASVTVTVVFAETPRKVAVTVAVPGLSARPSPGLPGPMDTPTILGSDEDHTTCALRSWVKRSEKR